jgi:hypothetical protein
MSFIHFRTVILFLIFVDVPYFASSFQNAENDILGGK